MNDINALRFILHVSDFHLSDDPLELNHASAALKALTEKLKSERIKVDYLVHTGDIIDSSDLYEKTVVALGYDISRYNEDDEGNEDNKDKKEEKTKNKFKLEKFEKNASSDEKKAFNEKLLELTRKRFSAAEKVMRKFISDLNISFGNVVICSGNHDVLRPLAITKEPVTCIKDSDNVWKYDCPDGLGEIFLPFEEFLNALEVANSKERCEKTEPVSQCLLGNLKILILNTNWKNPEDQKPGYYCVRCDQVKESIQELSENTGICDTLNVVLAHKPIYEICEKARLSYKRYIKTPFMSDLQKFVGDNGIYLCGDKHTRSIGGSIFHDIPHYIGGEPLGITRGKELGTEVEYNLLEISKCKLGMERKIHLTSRSEGTWNCEIRPQDTVVSKLYNLSKKYIIKNTFEIIADSKSFNSWESICQEIYNWKEPEMEAWYDNLNSLYQAVCKYRKYGVEDTSLQDQNIFLFVLERLKTQMNCTVSKNVMNVRGEYSSGKSTFLGLLYIFLLHQYSVGAIDFVPAYFNLESDEMFTRIESEGSYYDAVRHAFKDFVKKVQKIADKEHQSICYIIDGLDEQDCWSYSTEDSVGRGVLDVLASYDNAWYIMSFSQHRLPCFKNTMPARKYNDTSDIMYFNPIDVRERDSEDKRFTSFVEAFLKLKKPCLQLDDSGFLLSEEINAEGSKFAIGNQEWIEATCDIIRNFRRLTINPGFMYQNCNYITAADHDRTNLQHKNASVTDIYRYYIDRQDEICMDRLGYGFVHYAPAMAYLFTYKGYTYEKFKHLRGDNTLIRRHTLKSICENYDKVYRTFLFIKKHKDAREYLIALHYNRELRYYAEHPTEEIEEDSILNEFITRNISVMVRKLWSDTNKFVIACEQLLQREKLSNSVQSMLIYCLAHLQIYAPIRDQLYSQMRKKGEETLLKQRKKEGVVESSEWDIQGNDNTKKLTQFINLSLKHSLEIFSFMDIENSVDLVKSVISDRAFHKYNRQYQMLYYGDLSIQGEDKKRPLNPGSDIVYKGFDFHNCFNYLYVKLSSENQYPLREFDMFTMWDLIHSRLSVKYLDGNTGIEGTPNTFFYRNAFNEKAIKVLEQAKTIFEVYLSDHKEEAIPELYRYFKKIVEFLGKIIEDRKINGPTQNMTQLAQEFDTTNRE